MRKLTPLKRSKIKDNDFIVPEKHCVVCKSSATNKKIISKKKVFGVSLNSGMARIKHFSPNPVRAIPLEKADKFLVLWGEIWDKNTIKNAIASIENGRHPWICQKCSGYTCRKCQQDLPYTSGATILEDGGNALYCSDFCQPQSYQHDCSVDIEDTSN